MMELVPDAGRVLAERNPVPVKPAVRLVCQFLGGLAYAHARGFVRDIKPANVLVTAPAGGKRVAKLAGLPEVIHMALSREPGDRFADVLAFRAALLGFA